MSKVFVLNTQKQPLSPVTPPRARILLKQGQAAVFRRYPFSIILKEQTPAKPESLRLKIDPGSKTTGIALVDDIKGEVVWAGELTHRGAQIRDALTSRRQLRRHRRSRKTRYRQPRFLNRTRPKGWLSPSLESRVAQILTWVNKLCRLANIEAISQELVRFDMQLMQNPEISGIEYQQGTLVGYEIRQYLLEKWQRRCAYCGTEEVPMQVEHIQPRARGGSNRVSNLCLSCQSCNLKKGTQLIERFLGSKPEVLNRVLQIAKQPLRDAAAVNATRLCLYGRLQETGLPVEVGSGGLTKYNRTRLELNKQHWIDAACVGKSTPCVLTIKHVSPLLIAAKGHGTRQQCRTDKYGFPSRHCSRVKFHKGFQTGDMVKAIVTTGKKVGTYIGRLATRATGSFNISTTTGLVQGITHKYCQPIHRKDGYSYAFFTGE